MAHSIIIHHLTGFNNDCAMNRQELVLVNAQVKLTLLH